MLQAQQAGRLKWIRLWNIVQGKQRGVRPLQEIFGKWTRQIKVCLPANCILLHRGPASSSQYCEALSGQQWRMCTRSHAYTIMHTTA